MQNKLQANPDEVATIFRVPLSFLMNPKNHHHHRLSFNLQDQIIIRNWISIPYLEPSKEPFLCQPKAPQERFIWGISANIIRSLYDFLIVRLSQL
jgi:hypothetical protein